MCVDMQIGRVDDVDVLGNEIAEYEKEIMDKKPPKKIEEKEPN